MAKRLAWNNKRRVAARKAAETRRFRRGPWSAEEWEAAARRRLEYATGYEGGRP